ncbi:MAG: tRNA (adenosine(37)-N6)-dimethylallyltransferase MiaA [Alphaproteobacteria bacterium 43-37]|nr:MAG: tRNA (adenosine(37)-N6)-dimethylallyltransferase MiaA [Alphaproteobacteria bacterium 43-37]
MAGPIKKSILVIAGPTASGKTDLAMSVQTNSVIINGDSQQLYKSFPCLSALPTVEQMCQKPHRLYGILEAHQKCDVAAWTQWVKDEIRKAHENEDLPIIVGGTGFYLNTLLEGISFIPDVPNEVRQKSHEIEQRLGLSKLYEDLQKFDPPLYATFKPNDQSRIIRAWCVYVATQTPLSTFQNGPKQGGIMDDFNVMILALSPSPRSELYARIDTRFVSMIKHGAIEEIQSFKKLDYYESLPAFRAIGAKEIDAYLMGKIGLEEAVALGQQKSRNYAKRQLTWIRNKLPNATLWGDFGDEKRSQEYLQSLLIHRT